MTTPAAFRATYSDLKLIKTRQCVQIVFELPLADFDAAYNVLGGMPNPAKETWFGIAPLQLGKEAMPNPLPVRRRSEEGHDNAQPQPDTPRPAGAKRGKQDWRDMPPAQQAGIRCEEPTFAAFLREQRPDDWHEAPKADECVRLICGVDSRADLQMNQKARVIWKQLDDQYQVWKALEHA